MTLKVQANTKELLRALKNILELGKFSKESEVKDWMPSVLLAPQPSEPGEPNTLVIVGGCSHIVAIEEIELVGTGEIDAEDIDVLLKNATKTDDIDDLEKTIKAISGTSKSKDAVITIEITQDTKVAFWAGEELLSELPPYGRGREFFTRAMSWVDSEPREMIAPVMIDAGIFYRFKAVRPRGGANRPPNVDVVGVSDHPSGQVFIFKVGETLTGVYRSIDRESFAKGGPFLDGYGTPEALITER